ncbi:hypothetical protein [Hyphococcus sp.]|uniref:hypothetical protein n=1 Tax=Hyphococcus sp. TaxID=2038636 RepID=UPI003CCC1D7F
MRALRRRPDEKLYNPALRAASIPLVSRRAARSCTTSPQLLYNIFKRPPGAAAHSFCATPKTAIVLIAKSNFMKGIINPPAHPVDNYPPTLGNFAIFIGSDVFFRSALALCVYGIFQKNAVAAAVRAGVGGGLHLCSSDEPAPEPKNALRENDKLLF